MADGGPERGRRLGGDSEITQPGEGNEKQVIKEGVIDPNITEEGSLQPGKIPEAAVLPDQPGILDVKVGVVPRKSVRKKGDAAEIDHKTDIDENRLDQSAIFRWGEIRGSDIGQGSFHHSIT